MSHEFHIQTRVRMLYVSKTPAHNDFLARLREIADVTVDENNIIERYEAFDGSLTLGKPKRQEKADLVESMLNFLAEITRNVEEPISSTELLSIYKVATRHPFHSCTLQAKFGAYVKPRIHVAEQFDIPTRVRMLFVSKTPVDDSFLARLRENASVEVDGRMRITKYESTEGSLKLGIVKNADMELLEISNPIIKKTKAANMAMREGLVNIRKEPDNVRRAKIDKQFIPKLNKNDAMLNFLAEISQNSVRQMSNEMLATKYQLASGDSSSTIALRDRFGKFVKPRIQWSEQFDIPTRVRMLYISKTPVDDDNFLKRLRENADVTVDDKNIIKGYKATDGSLTLGKIASNFQEDPIVSVNEKKIIERFEGNDGSLTLGKENNNQKAARLEKHKESRNDWEYGEKEQEKGVVPWATRTGRITTKRRHSSTVADCSMDEENERNFLLNFEKTKKSFIPTSLEDESIEYSVHQSTSESRHPEQESAGANGMDQTHNAPPIKQERTDEDVLYGGGMPPLPIPFPVKKEVPHAAAHRSSCNSRQPRTPNNDNDVINTIQDQVDNNGDGKTYSREPVSLGPSELNRIVKKEDPDIICLTRFIPDNSHSIHLDESSNDFNNRSRAPSQTVSIAECRENENVPMQLDITDPVDVQPSESDNEFTSAKGFLKMLRAFVLTISSPTLSPIEQRIKNAIGQVRNDNLPMDDALFSLETIFRLTTKQSSSREDPEASFPVAKIITILRNIIFNFDSPKISTLEEKMKKVSAHFEVSGDKISSKTLQLALETTIELINPH